MIQPDIMQIIVIGCLKTHLKTVKKVHRCSLWVLSMLYVFHDQRHSFYSVYTFSLLLGMSYQVSHSNVSYRPMNGQHHFYMVVILKFKMSQQIINTFKGFIDNENTEIYSRILPRQVSETRMWVEIEWPLKFKMAATATWNNLMVQYFHIRVGFLNPENMGTVERTESCPSEA